MADTDEATPLIPAAVTGQAAVLIPVAKDLAKDLGKELAKRAGALRDALRSGNTTFRFLALLGGCACAGTGLLGLLGHFLFLSWVRAFVDVYKVAFGLAVVVIEAKKQVLPRKYKIMLHNNFKFLDVMVGRALFYLFASTLFLTASENLIDLAVGLYWTVLTGMYFVYAYATNTKLRSMAAESDVKTPNDLKRMFDKYDVDGNGELDSEELAALTLEMGTTLSAQELCAALSLLDHDNSGAVDFREFRAWWFGRDAPWSSSSSRGD